MNKRGIVLGMAIAAVFLVAMVGSASALCDQTVNPDCHGCCYIDSGTGHTMCYECGDTVTESCTFDADLNCSAGAHGLIAGADNIVIDGYNNTLRGPGGVNTQYYGIYNGQSYDNVTIANLTVEGFFTGIWIEGTYSNRAERNNITNCTVRDNGNRSAGYPNSPVSRGGIWCKYCCNSSITNCKIYNNTGKLCDEGCEPGGVGVFLHSYSDHNTIANNSIHNNYVAGIYSKMRCMHNYVADNEVYENGHVYDYCPVDPNWYVGGGIRLECMMTNYWLVEHNYVHDNIGPGIYVRGKHNVFRYNNVTNETDAVTTISPDSAGFGLGAGMYSCGVNNTIYNNTVCNNSYKGRDIYNQNGFTGNNNTCTFALDYCDDDALCPPPCVNICPGALELDLRVLEKYETWHNDTHYYVNYTIVNYGWNTTLSSNPGHAGILIDGQLVDTQYVPALSGYEQHTNASGPWQVTGIDNVTVCADIYNTTAEGDETNNCTSNIFGGPDLTVPMTLDSLWEPPYGDASLKNFSVSYTIENIGDKRSNASVTKFILMDENLVEVCNITNSTPALDPGESSSGIVGPFTMPGTKCYFRVVADATDNNTENSEDNNWTRFMPSYNYPGCCDECGDVNCRDGVTAGDTTRIRAHLHHGVPLDCGWAADVNCRDGVTAGDTTRIRAHLHHGVPLPCCGGRCPT